MRRPATPDSTPETSKATTDATPAAAGRWRRALVAVVPAVLAVAVFLAVYFAVRDRLPDELATHMGPDGRADGFTDRTAFVVTAALALTGVGALFALLSRLPARAGQASVPRAMSAMGAGTLALLDWVLVMLLLANTGIDDPATVRFSGWHILWALAAWAVTGALAWFAAGPDPAPAARTDDGPASGARRLPLGPGEQIAWTRTAGSPGVLAAGGVTVATLAVTGAYAGWWLLALAVPLGAAFAATGRIRVTADARGLTVTPAGLRRPRVRIPLDEIATASARRVSAVRDFGGFGYRIRAGASGVILRSGDALAVDRASGGTFLVTVDDAATAAATLNALAARAHRAAP
ncbi:hypothetical protein ABZ714_15195 [Streptomyces sp. NPDC006798]|uniref:hypothetical protein n=1 Tax=Streptomyces sp. NPDC006798 TaxID=3155462 RepID=UPI0033D6929B